MFTRRAARGEAASEREKLEEGGVGAQWVVADMDVAGMHGDPDAQAKELVTHGLYSRIQNPVYVFGGMFFAGLVLFFGRPELFLIFLIMIPMQVMRIRKERQVLEAKFGDAYCEYRKRTWF